MMTAESSARSELDEWLHGLGLRLSPQQWLQLGGYLQDLEDYNRKTNITSDKGDSLILRHVADGLAALPVLRSLLREPAPSLVDIGAGGGFIGLSIKIAWPEASVTLMESSYRKFQFLNWAAARLGLKGLHVRWQRAARKKPYSLPATAFGTAALGAVPEGAAPFDVALARAVAPLHELLPVVRNFVKPSTGLFVSHQNQMPDAAGREHDLSRGADRIQRARSTTSLAVPGGYARQVFPVGAADLRLRKTMDQTKARLIQTTSYRLPRESQERYLAVFQFGGPHEPS